MERKISEERILEELIEECEELLKSDKQSEKILSILGRAYLYAKEYEKSENCFKKVLVMNPENVDFHNNLGCAYKEMERFEEAIKEFEYVLSKKKYADVHKNLGEIYLKTGFPDKAFFEYKTANGLAGK